MDFAYTEEHTALRKLTRQVIEQHASATALEQAEQSGSWYLDGLWRALAAQGLLGVAVAPEHGGSGLGLIELGILLTEVGRATAPVPAWAVLATGALPLQRFGSAALRGHLLPGVTSGSALVVAALLEPAALSPRRPVTRATRRGREWHIEGEKVCVPAADRAAALLVPATVEGAGVGVFVLDPRAPGATLERQMSAHGEPEFTLRLRGAVCTDDQVLVPPEPDGRSLAWIVDCAELGLCTLQVGVVERALEMTAKYTAERTQFGRPIATFQAVSQRAADAYIDAQALRLSTLSALWRVSEGVPAPMEVAIARYWAAEGGHRVTAAAQHLHGGVGFDRSYPLHRCTLWARSIELTLGGAVEQLEHIGQQLESPGA